MSRVLTWGTEPAEHQLALAQRVMRIFSLVDFAMTRRPLLNLTRLAETGPA